METVLFTVKREVFIFLYLFSELVANKILKKSLDALYYVNNSTNKRTDQNEINTYSVILPWAFQTGIKNYFQFFFHYYDSAF